MKTPPRVSEALLRDALNRLGVQGAAVEFGVDRRTVYRWMEVYGIKRLNEFDKAA